MRNTIWNNDLCEAVEGIKADQRAGEIEEDLTDTDIWDMACESINMWFDDECTNLNINLDSPIILTGTIQTWRGGFSAYKELDTNNIADAMKAAVASFDGDNSFEIYEENGGIFLSQYGHDNPTSPSIVEFRMLTNDLYDLEDDSPETLRANSSPIGRYAREVYGWAEEVA